MSSVATVMHHSPMPSAAVSFAGTSQLSSIYYSTIVTSSWRLTICPCPVINGFVYEICEIYIDPESMMPLVSWLIAFFFRHVVVAQAWQCVRDELMNFFSRNMAQVKTCSMFLEKKFISSSLREQKAISILTSDIKPPGRRSCKRETNLSHYCIDNFFRRTEIMCIISNKENGDCMMQLSCSADGGRLV